MAPTVSGGMSSRMARPEVSVAMPVFNAAATVREAIESIRAQTLENWELVIVDDGSTDGTEDLLRDFAHEDDRIRVLHRAHRGIVAAANEAILEARCDLVARMDADDVSLPERLAEQVAVARARPDVAVVGCLIECFPRDTMTDGMARYESWLNELVEAEDIAREIFVESPLVNPSVLMRREVVRSLGGYREGPFPEDYDLWLRLHGSGHRMVKVPKVLYRWRDSSDRMTRRDPRYSRSAFRRLKVAHVVDSFLRGRQDVQIWGAGREGRLWRRALKVHGVRVVRFFDIDPAKIGRMVGNEVPILDRREIGYHRDIPLLCAVATWGAREEMRTFLREYGFVEGRDVVFVA